jgi:hypothetical protein
LERFGADVAFEIFAEVSADIVESLKIFLQATDEEGEFESGDDEFGKLLRMDGAAGDVFGISGLFHDAGAVRLHASDVEK